MTIELTEKQASLLMKCISFHKTGWFNSVEEHELGKVADELKRLVSLEPVKAHCFRVRWQTNTRFVSRSYSRDFATEAEAVAKARQVHDKADPISTGIRIDEVESWDTPDPAPNGTHHCNMLRMNIDWWTGFLPWWDTAR